MINKGGKNEGGLSHFPTGSHAYALPVLCLFFHPYPAALVHREMNQGNQVIGTQPRATALTAQPMYSLSDLSDTRKKS